MDDLLLKTLNSLTAACENYVLELEDKRRELGELRALIKGRSAEDPPRKCSACGAVEGLLPDDVQLANEGVRLYASPCHGRQLENRQRAPSSSKGPK